MGKKRQKNNRVPKWHEIKDSPLKQSIETKNVEYKSEETEPRPSVHEKTRTLKKMSPQRELDLHGCNCVEAEEKLTQFFNKAVSDGVQKVSIIFGKGIHTNASHLQDNKHNPIKTFTLKFLETHPHAGETTTPKGRDGGSGTVWVIIK